MAGRPLRRFGVPPSLLLGLMSVTAPVRPAWGAERAGVAPSAWSFPVGSTVTRRWTQLVGGEQVAYESSLSLAARDGDVASLTITDRYPGHDPVTTHARIADDALWSVADIDQLPPQRLLIGDDAFDCVGERRTRALGDGGRIALSIWRHAGAGVPDRLVRCDHPISVGPDAVLVTYEHRDAATAAVETRQEWAAATRIDVSVGDRRLAACRVVGTDTSSAAGSWQSTTFEVLLAAEVPGHEVSSRFCALTDKGPAQVVAQTLAWTTP